MRLRDFVAASCIAIGALSAAPAMALTIFVTTSDVGANDPVSAGNPRLWTFTVPLDATWSFGGGFFSMKNGNSAVENTFVQLDLYSSGLTTSLGSFQYSTISSFVAAGADGGSGYRDNVPFQLTTPVDLIAGESYDVVMSSNAPAGGSTQFFIKTATGTTLTVVTDPNALPPTIEVPPTTDTPEPASALILAAGMAGIGMVRRRRAQGEAALTT